MNHSHIKKKGTAIRLFSYLGRQKVKLILILTSIVFSTVLALATPLVIGKTINHIADGVKEAITRGTHFQVNLQTMGGLLGLLLALYLLNFALKYFEQYLMSDVAETICFNMRQDLSSKLERLPLRFYDSTEKGEILSRATSDIEKVAESLREGLGQFITAVITIVGSIILMLYINPLLTFISLFTMGIATTVTAFIAKRSRRNFSNYQTTLGHLNANIEEVFTGQLVIKAFNHEKTTIEDFQKINNKLCEVSCKAQISMYIVPPIVRVINSFGYILIALLSGLFIIQGKLSIGIVQAFIQYTDRISEPVIECSFIINTMQSAIAASQRFFEILDKTEEVPESQGAIKNLNPQGAVVFEHVRFGYNDDAILMHDVNIRVKSGDKIAIVGPTGAGKTTLVNLLMRFYEIQGGKITIDGIDIKNLSHADLRQNFGMVLQDTWLFGGTIRDNIAYSNFEATDDQVIAAAKAARIDHFIRTMPEGYNTEVSEDASNLSQGQRQLLTIARVILANPSILILDEATSSVDTRTEMEIQKAMDNLMKGRTSFIIAHRLSTIRDANSILVMNNGTIIEQGTHTELLEQKGFYENLYNSQFINGIVSE